MHRRLTWLSLIAIPCGLLVAAGTVRADDSAGAKALWSQPPREYSTGPLWVWNDMLTEEQVLSSLRDLAGQKVRQAWVHPRPGLMTPYLSNDWFRLWKAALAEAEKLDMNLWIYDENSYPSGFAGGLVPEAMPESRGRGLVAAGGPHGGQTGRRRAGRLPLGRPDLRQRHPAGPRRPAATRRPLLGGLRPAGAQQALERRPLLRRSALPGSDGEVFGGHAGGLSPADWRAVRPSRARLVQRRAQHSSGRRIALDGAPARAVCQALGLRADRAVALVVSSAGRLAAGAAQLLPASLGAVHRALEQALSRLLPGDTAWNGPATIGTTNGPTATPCPTTWPCTPGTSGRPSTA